MEEEAVVQPEAEAEPTPAAEESIEAAPPEEVETTDPDTEEEAPEVIEFDFGGNKFSVQKDQIPPELAEQVQKFGGDLYSDYTRKTQDIAETRKSLEAREASIQNLSTLNEDVLNTYSQGVQIRNELERLSKIELDWQSNPDQARQVSDAISNRRAQLAQVVQELGSKESALKQAQDDEASRRRDEGRVAIEKRIPGFSEKVADVVDYVATSYGIPKDVAERDWPLNPATAEMAYKAMLFDRAQAATAAKPTPKPATAVKPVKGKGGGVKNPDRMSTEDWMRERQRQLAGR